MTPPNKQPLVPALRSLLEEEARSEHPAPERLIDYQSGWLTAEERGRVEAHLGTCPECKELLADLAAFEAHTPALKSAAQPDREAQVAWKRLKEQLAKDKKRPGTVRPFHTVPSPEAPQQPHHPATLWASPRAISLLAAALFAVSVGLTIWVISLKAKVAQLSQPIANVAASELHSDAVRGVETPVPGGSEPILFLLDMPEDHPSAELTAEIRKAGSSNLLLKVGGLRQMEAGTLNVFVPRSLLPPGDYQIDLFKESQLLTSYHFTIASP